LEDLHRFDVSCYSTIPIVELSPNHNAVSLDKKHA
jgi:hypothetical protein